MSRLAVLRILSRTIGSGFLTRSTVATRRFSSKKLPGLSHSTSPAIASNKTIDNELDQLRNRRGDLEIDWTEEMATIKREDDNYSVLKPLTYPYNIDTVPDLMPTFNFAAYVTKSETLQKLVEMGVDLSRIERRKGLPQFVMKLDFECDIQPRLLYLIKDVGIDPHSLGWFITKNPLIFKENLDNLRTRINYLQSKSFTAEQITGIVQRNPFWLMFNVERIDNRLGYFQKEFRLTGPEVRHLAIAKPQLITYNLESVQKVSFSVLEEMEMTRDQMKELLLKHPRIWTKSESLAFVSLLDPVHKIEFSFR